MEILAVDDDPVILEILSQFVETLGEHTIITASSAQEALEFLSSSKDISIDCFLFDIQMPNMDGIQLLKEIRQTARFADTPTLMLTAMTDRPHIDAAFSAGATDYLTKPFDFTDLKARMGLIQDLVQARRIQTTKVFSRQNDLGSLQTSTPKPRLELHEAISIYDVDNVIEHLAMENYIAQLSRGALFGSSTFAFSIRKIEEHHQSLSAFEFSSMISDVAEVISDTLNGHQFLMSYAGSGTFVCVTESGWRPVMSKLMDAVNLSLSRTELYNNAGERLFVRVSAGKAIRLIWKSKETVLEAMSEAYISADTASTKHEEFLNDFWMVEQRA